VDKYYFMVKFLGAIDLFAGLALFSITGGVTHFGIFIVLVVILLLKSSISFFDIGGVIDIIVAILIFLSLFITLPYFVLLAGMIIIGLKGLISVAS